MSLPMSVNMQTGLVTVCSCKCCLSAQPQHLLLLHISPQCPGIPSMTQTCRLITLHQQAATLFVNPQDIEPNFFLSLLLPLIIYSAAISMHWHTLRRCLFQVITIVSYLITTGCAGAVSDVLLQITHCKVVVGMYAAAAIQICRTVCQSAHHNTPGLTQPGCCSCIMFSSTCQGKPFLANTGLSIQ